MSGKFKKYSQLIINSMKFKKIKQFDNSTPSNVIFDYDKVYIKNLFLDPFCSKKNIDLILCILSGLLYKYEDLEYINKVCSSWGLTNDNYNIYNLNGGRLIFGIFIIQKKILVIFKGSSSIDDFMSDLDFVEYDSPEDYTLGKVHRGFYDKLFEIENGKPRCSYLIDLIQKYPDNYDIYMSGHSLGGGLATVFYPYLKHDKDISNKITIVTFGCPRTGDAVFKNSINLITRRYIYNNDLVPHLPLAIFGYRHIPNHIHLKPYNINGSISCSDLLGIWSVEDHHIDNYFYALI